MVNNNSKSKLHSIPYVVNIEDTAAQIYQGGAVTVTCINAEGEDIGTSNGAGDSVNFTANNTVGLEIIGDVGPDYEITIGLNGSDAQETFSFRAAGDGDRYEIPAAYENRSIRVNVAKAPGSPVSSVDARTASNIGRAIGIANDLTSGVLG